MILSRRSRAERVLSMKIMIVGGLGFIGSHMTRRQLENEAAAVVVYDNFSSGRLWHLGDRAEHPRLKIVRSDVKDLPALTAAMEGVDKVYHYASNPDIAKAMRQPDIDFWEGTYLTQNVLEAMRVQKVKRLLYASGSGVYGDAGEVEVHENFSPMLPISTYGASKLACEALICSYCHMFDMNARAFRFANVVGPRPTHGVCYDFVRRLLKDPTTLQILGDGTQSKSYVHVEDVLEAIEWVGRGEWSGFDYFNVATKDYMTVTQIADLVIERMGLRGVQYDYSGGPRGWKGDVPVVRFNTDKLRKLGWSNRRTTKDALTDCIDSVIADAKEGKFEND
jgi:UDP-glucose 4-epimerase